MEITPTLVIGIGGTGKKVVLEIKRQLSESYGYKPKTNAHRACMGYPVINFLCIDADTTDNSRIYENNVNDATTDAPDHVKLLTDEFVGATINSQQYNSYKNNLQGHPHISNWMPQSVMDSNTPAIVSNGAGQHRLFGRLCFFQGFYDIKKSITDKINEIYDAIKTRGSWIDLIKPKVSLPQTPDNANPQFEVHIYIVNSLAGGTGCGMFLDISMLTKNIVLNDFKNSNLKFSIHNIALMPSGYLNILDPGMKDKILANAYAALKEVEYLSLPTNQYPTLGYPVDKKDSFIQWSPNPADKYKISGRDMEIPWDVFYLVDTVNKNQIKISNSSCIRMIADRIFLNFDYSRLPSELRICVPNNQGNLKGQYINEIKSNQRTIVNKIVSMRFGTFGLSFYKYDRDNLKRRAAHVLGERFCDYWLNKTSVTTLSSADQNLLASELIGKRLNDDYDDIFKEKESLFSPGTLCCLLLSKRTDYILDYLRKTTTASPRSFSFLQDFDNDFSLLNNSNTSADPYANLLDFTKKHEGRLKKPEMFGSRSESNIYDDINKNFNCILAEIPKFIENLMVGLISEHGVVLSLNILDRIKDIINGWISLNSELGNRNIKTNEFDARIKDAKKIRLPWFRTIAVDLETRRVFNEIHDRFESAYYSATFDKIGLIYQKLMEYFFGTRDSQKISAYQATKKFEQFLFTGDNSQPQTLGHLFRINKQMLLGLNTAPAAQGAPDHRVVFGLETQNWTEEKFKAHIASQLGVTSFQDITEKEFQAIEAKVFQHYSTLDRRALNLSNLGKLQNILYEFDSIISTDQSGSINTSKDVYNSIINACTDALPTFADEISISDILQNDPNYNDRIENLVNYSAPYLYKAMVVNELINLPNTTWKPTKQILACKYNIPTLHGNLINVNNGGVSNLEHTSMADDSIALYQELLAFPLGSIAIIKDLSDAYEKKRPINTELHLNYEFREYSPDIRPVVYMQNNDFIDALKNTIKGIIIKTIELNTKSSCYILNDPKTGQVYKFSLVLDQFVDRLLVSDDLNNLLKSKNLDFDKKMGDERCLAYWVALAKLWVDLRLATTNTNNHPIMEIIDAVMIPDFLNQRPDLENNPGYKEIFDKVSLIKASLGGNTQTIEQHSREFNQACLKFLSAPSSDALALKDYFSIWVLK